MYAEPFDMNRATVILSVMHHWSVKTVNRKGKQKVHQLYEEGRIEAQWVGLMLVFTESDVKEFKNMKRRPPKGDV